MKRILAVILAMLLLVGCIGSYAETNGNPPEKPSGEMGQPPEDMGEPPQGGLGGEPPQGGPGGEMGNPPDGMGGPSGNGGPGGDAAKPEGMIGSWSSGGSEDYEYDAALYITGEGIDEAKSSTDRIASGAYDASGADGIVIEDTQSGDNGIIVVNADYAITNADISLLTDADGSDTCDFSGRGSAIAVYGSEASVIIEDSTIHTSGVATMPVFADDGATVTIRNSTLQSDGGTLSADYMNTPDQALMVAPPWILGIMGTSRSTNMMGDNTTTNVIHSETSAGAWAVLSTDAGTDMALNVYNTTLTLNNADESAAAPLQAEDGEISQTLDNPYTVNYGSGYGTYAIGNAVETFAGATINVGTYATIFTGGSATYTALEAGETYELTNAAGETTATYTATEDKATDIHSDTFGFMAHQGSNAIDIEKGTVVDSGYATFLVKSGSSNETLTATVDDATISNGGVLIQVMDNDDTTNGGMMDADDPENTNGGSQNFKPYHTEDAGFNTDAASAGSTAQTFAFTNGTYTGNIYNASGSDGLEGTALNVTFGIGAEYTGAIASTSAIHVTYDGSAAVK
ncbi:MAG: hypothetical protein IJI59_03220, partial [Clostridia bacterium]|nr:hypothetical protein [Clostridia bacterium]